MTTVIVKARFADFSTTAQYTTYSEEENLFFQSKIFGRTIEISQLFRRPAGSLAVKFAGLPHQE